jgi:Mn2+/Fe2+ NRAMP family transporter
VQLVEIFLGILTAMGGFVDVGELVFSIDAGARFAYSLLWVLAFGTIGIMVYGEMAGRVAAVAKVPVFGLIRERVGFTAGLLTLICANLLGLLTCAAEIGGIAIVLRLALEWPHRILILVGFVALVLSVWVLPFKWIERVFGLLGLAMIVFVLAAWRLQPDWHAVATGLVPSVPRLESRSEYLVYAYFAVSLLSATMLPYETYFYGAGAIEDHWTRKYLSTNRLVVGLGFILGSTLSAALVIIGAKLFLARGLEPDYPGAAALGPAMMFGRTGLFVSLFGMLFAFGGAAVENALTGAYNLAQFFGWPWGKAEKPAKAPRFTVAWLVMLSLATLIVLTGVDPIKLVEYAIVVSVVILPLTYLPLLTTANDERVMGRDVNGRLARTLGWFFFVVVSLAGLAAVPLLVMTRMGKA